MDLPGVAPSDLDVTIANGFLTIKAERRQVPSSYLRHFFHLFFGFQIHEEDTVFTHKIERSYGKVQRSVTIPTRANADQGIAKFENGILMVILIFSFAVG